MDGKFVAIKMHFGEPGNISFLRPNYAARGGGCGQGAGRQAVPDGLQHAVSRQPQERASSTSYCAWENGFTPLTVGCPVIIGDGLKGTDDIGVPVAGGEYIKEAQDWPRHHGCGRVHQPDPLQGPRDDRFRRHDQKHRHGLRLTRRQDGAALQRQAEHQRGSLSRLHAAASENAPTAAWCSTNEKRKMHVDHDQCVGCGRCLGACNFDAISFDNCDANELLNCPHG